MKKIFTFFTALILFGSMMVVQAVTYTPAGSPASVFTNEWTPNTPANDMVLSNGLYVFAKKGNFASKTSISFKVCKDHAWTTAYPGSNYGFDIPAGSKYLIITYNTSGNAVNAFAISSMTVAGDNATLFGSTWAPTATANDMTLQEDGTYKFEKTGVALSAGTVKFKACANHGWDNAWPSANYELSIPESGNYTITITFDPKTLVVSATADLEEAVVVIPNIQLHSNIQNPSWASTANFDIAGNNETASLTLTSVTKGNYEFGVKIDGTWTSNGSAFTRANPSHEVVAGSGNCTFNADRNGDYTFTWTYETNTLEITYPAIPAQSVAFDGLDAQILKGSNVVFAATSSGIDNPGYRFYVKPQGGEYGVAVTEYNFDALGAFKVKVEALEDNAGDPVASDEADVVVYDAHTFHSGDVIYVDFSAMTEGTKGVNYPKANEVGLDYDAAGAGTLKTVTFSADVEWTTNDVFVKTEKAGWAELKFTVPGSGENCAVVAADGASYTWTTYVAPPPTIKMHGNFLGSWANTEAFVLAGSNETASLTLNIQTKGEKEFGVRIGSDDNWTSNGATISRASSSAEIISGSGNCKLDVDAKGDYTFTWTFASNTLSVTYPALPAQSVAFDGLDAQILKGSNVVFAATSSGIDNPGYRFYVKPQGGEYGVAVTEYNFDALGAFKVKVEALEDNAGDPVASDEADVVVYDAHTFTNGTTIYVDFSAMTEGTKGVNFPFGNKKDELDYDAAGAGTFKTVTFSADVEWTTNDDFIKTEKAGWAELKFTVPGSGENCAVVAADGASYSWSTYVEPAPVYTVAGSASAFGTNWNVDDAANEMILDGGVYKLTKTDRTLVSGIIEFKVVKNHEYAQGEWPASNYQLAILEAGVYTIEITFDPANVGDEISATATKTGEAVVTPTITIDGSWDWGNKTTLTGDETSVSTTIHLDAGTHYFKMLVNGDHRSNGYYYHRDFPGAEGITENKADMSLGADIAGDYTFTWTFETNGIEITFPAVDYTREGLTAGDYGTICLPKAGTIVGATLYEIGSFENSLIYIDEVGSALAAGVPYIFQATSSKLRVFYTDKTAEDVEAGNANGLIGFYNLSNPTATFNIPEDAGNYILYNNQYWLVSGRAAYIANYRAYIKLGSITPKAAAPGRRRVAMTVNGENAATGFENIESGDAPMKVMIEGTMYILRGEKVYDATGRLVK